MWSHFNFLFVTDLSECGCVYVTVLLASTNGCPMARTFVLRISLIMTIENILIFNSAYKFQPTASWVVIIVTCGLHCLWFSIFICAIWNLHLKDVAQYVHSEPHRQLISTRDLQPCSCCSRQQACRLRQWLGVKLKKKKKKGCINDCTFNRYPFLEYGLNDDW